MGEVVPPIFLVDGLDVEAFGSIDDLTGYVEPIDARDEGHKCFDSAGLPLQLDGGDVQETGTGWIRWISGGKTSLTPGQTHEPEALRAALIKHITAVGPERFSIPAQDLDGLDLKRLVEAVVSLTTPRPRTRLGLFRRRGRSGTD